MSGKLSYRNTLNSINAIAAQIIAALNDDPTARQRAEKQLQSLTQALLSEYGHLPVNEEPKTPSVSLFRANTVAPPAPTPPPPSDKLTIQPKAMPASNVPQEIKRLMEFTEMGVVDWVLTLPPTSAGDAKNALFAFHSLFSVLFYTCILTPSIKFSLQFESLFKNDNEASFNFLILQTADFHSIFVQETFGKQGDFTENLIYLEKYLIERRVNMSETAKENYKSLKGVWDEKYLAGLAEAAADWNAFLRLATELIVESLGIVGKVVLLFKGANSQMKLKSLHIGPSEKQPDVQVIVFVNDLEMSVFGVVTPDDQYVPVQMSSTQGAAKPFGRPDGRNACTPDIIGSRGQGIGVFDNSQQSRLRGESDPPHQGGGHSAAHQVVGGSEFKDRRPDRSVTPKRVISITNGPPQEKKEMTGFFDDLEKDGKTERTQTKFGVDMGGMEVKESKSKIDSESKLRIEPLGRQSNARSYSVSQRKEPASQGLASAITKTQVDSHKIPPPKPFQVSGPPPPVITAKDLSAAPILHKESEKSKVGGILRFSRQETNPDETKNDPSDFFAIPDFKDIPVPPLLGLQQHQNSVSANQPNSNTSAPYSGLTIGKVPEPTPPPAAVSQPAVSPPVQKSDANMALPNPASTANQQTSQPQPQPQMNTLSSANVRPKAKTPSFFSSFQPILSQASDYSKFVNENTKVIQELYKPLPTSAPRAIRITKDSMDFWKQNKGSFHEKAGDENPSYARMFERNLEELDKARQMSMHSLGMGAGGVNNSINTGIVSGSATGEGLGSAGPHVKVVRLNTNTFAHQRQGSSVPEMDLKMPGSGLNFRRVGTQGNNQLDMTDPK